MNRFSDLLLPLVALVSFLLLLTGPANSQASDWSTTELFYQNGRLSTPDFAGGGKHQTTVITLQHASGWSYGDNFFFIDHLNDSNEDSFSDNALYGELYMNFSLGKIFAHKFALGSVKDVGLVMGINTDSDANVMKYLPGLRLSWQLPGFAFLNTDFTAYMDDSDGVKAGTGNAPSEGDSFMIDISWAYPFSVGGYDFSIEGHMEYIDERQNQFGAEIKSWFLAQPQFRFDLGKALTGREKTLFVGVKWQYWQNKLGEGSTDENALMALVVWRL